MYQGQRGERALKRRRGWDGNGAGTLGRQLCGPFCTFVGGVVGRNGRGSSFWFDNHSRGQSTTKERTFQGDGLNCTEVVQCCGGGCRWCGG